MQEVWFVFLLSDYRGYKNLSVSLSKLSCITCQILAPPEGSSANALSKLNNCINPGGRG